MLWHFWDEEGNQPAAAALGVLFILFLTFITFAGRVFITRGFRQT
jgi:hypothetical protein